MVTGSGHGGHCCGAYHMYRFGGDDEANPDGILTLLAGIPTGRSVNVMLNLRQMTTMPRVLQKLADLGFVLEGHFINDNHGSHVFQFSRAHKRLPFTGAALEALHIAWPGMVIDPRLTGNLPDIPAHARPAAVGAIGGYVYTPGNMFRIADVHSPVNNLVLPLVRHVNGLLTFVNPASGRECRVSQFDVTFVSAPRVAPVPAPAVPPQRHTLADGAGLPGPQVILQPAPVAPPVPVIVACFWSNSYRTSGRSAHLFATRAAALAVVRNPGRGNTVDRLDVYSDGAQRWVINAA